MIIDIQDNAKVSDSYLTLNEIIDKAGVYQCADEGLPGMCKVIIGDATPVKSLRPRFVIIPNNGGVPCLETLNEKSWTHRKFVKLDAKVRLVIE